MREKKSVLSTLKIMFSQFGLRTLMIVERACANKRTLPNHERTMSYLLVFETISDKAITKDCILRMACRIALTHAVIAPWQMLRV